MEVSVITCLKRQVLFSSGMTKNDFKLPQILGRKRKQHETSGRIRMGYSLIVTCRARWEIVAGHSWGYGLWLRAPTYLVLLRPGLGGGVPFLRCAQLDFGCGRAERLSS